MHYSQPCDELKILEYSKRDENCNLGEIPKHTFTYFSEKFSSHIRPYAKCSPLVPKWAIYFPKLSWEIRVLPLYFILEIMLCVHEFVYCENGRIRMPKLNICQILKRSADYRVGLLHNGYLNLWSYLIFLWPSLTSSSTSVTRRNDRGVKKTKIFILLRGSTSSKTQ
jgi:hypothetical protein